MMVPEAGLEPARALSRVAMDFKSCLGYQVQKSPDYCQGLNDGTRGRT